MSKTKSIVGDIFEIDTPVGKAYLHFIYQHPTNCELVRVLPGLYLETPDNIEAIAAMQERYLVLFPLNAAYKRKIVRKVGYASPEAYSMPKYMREIHIVRGEFLGWLIVDTDTLVRRLVKVLSPEEKQLSSFGIWNDTLLCKRLVEDWSLENWGHEWGDPEGR